MRLKKVLLAGVCASVVAALGLASTANAASVSFTATDNTASATLSTSGNTLTVILTNLTTANGTGSAGNLLTGFELLPTDISSTGYSVTGQTGAQEFTFSSSKVGAISSGSFDPTWALTNSPVNGLYFNGFGTGGVPIIGGPATGGTNYNNANASLTSGPHGNYIYETATFTLTTPGAFNLANITGVDFFFNTDGSIEVGSGPGTPGGSGSAPSTPLPAAVWGGSALMLGIIGKRAIRHRRA